MTPSRCSRRSTTSPADMLCTVWLDCRRRRRSPVRSGRIQSRRSLHMCRSGTQCTVWSGPRLHPTAPLRTSCSWQNRCRHTGQAHMPGSCCRCQPSGRTCRQDSRRKSLLWQLPRCTTPPDTPRTPSWRQSRRRRGLQCSSRTSSASRLSVLRLLNMSRHRTAHTRCLRRSRDRRSQPHTPSSTRQARRTVWPGRRRRRASRRHRPRR